MVIPSKKQSNKTRLLLWSGLLFSLALWGCGGGGGGGSGVAGTGGGTGDGYPSPQPKLYQEAPAIDVRGGGVDSSEVLFFVPKGPKKAELYDSDEDGIPDTPINDYIDYVNAANNMYDMDIAACYGQNNGQGDPPVFTDAYQPDTMPITAVNGTQYIQIILPFDLKPGSIFDGSPLNFGSDYLKGNISIIDEDNEHVNATVLLDGKDARYYYDPVAYPQGDDYTKDPNWPDEIIVAPNVLVFIAQPQVDVATGSLPAVPTAFTSTVGAEFDWRVDKKEILIRISTVRDVSGEEVDVNASYYVLKNDPAFDPSDQELLPDIAPTDITAFDIIGTDPDQVAPDNLVVTRETSFILTFNKPVVPDSVGMSLLFNRPPFNGNSKVVTNKYIGDNPPPAPCGSITPPPIGSNVSLIAFFVDENGASQTQAIIPFRCYPLHQNNLATYILNPLIDLPGSTPSELNLINPIKIRLEVTVYFAGQNAAGADPDDAGPLSPINLAPTGYFGETFTGGGQVVRRVFTVEEGGRYVNAPVPPGALYYSMGPNGIGAVDLDGNGFTTNHPNVAYPALVTSLRFYNKYGNNAMGTGNDYAYGAKANPGNPIGLGATTSVPGINEGSDGIDTVVKDSLGNAQLHPDSTGDEKFYNISDIEIGDFLDAIFFDSTNRWVKDTFHVSFLLGTGLNFANNVIDTPPTPNPPPLTIPIGMRAVDVVVDEKFILEEGAYVIMGKEVFATPTHLVFPPTQLPFDTTFIHLQWGALANPPSSIDIPFPPNPTAGFTADFINTGPLAESSTLGTGYWYASRQQIGNFLFAADKSNNIVRVVNSNSMDIITTISGFSSPDSVTVSTDLTTLYVSNAGSGILSVFNANPRTSDFLSHIADIPVGSQPKGICMQPDRDDVLVCNFGNSSISIINPKTNTVRKTVSSLVSKPWDLVAGPRQTTFGWGTGVYHAFISNFGNDKVLVFESGPDGLGGIGFDDILDPVPEQGAGGFQWNKIQRPRGICWDPHFVQPYYLSGGCFVAHRSGSYSMVSRIQFTKQQGGYGPIFLQPNSGAIGGTPGFGKRIFEITAQWGGLHNPLSGGSGGASDVALIDVNRNFWLNNNWIGDPYVTNYGAVRNNPAQGMPYNHKHPTRIVNRFGIFDYYPVALSDHLYIAHEFSPAIDVVNVLDGSIVKTITGLPAPAKILKTYFKY